MSGLVLGTLSVGWWPSLPPVPLALLLILLAAFITGYRRRLLACALAGMLLGMGLGILHGQDLLARRLPGVCSGEMISLRGEVASLPRISAMADGTQRQRFELLVTGLAPEHCKGPRRVLLSFYGPEALLPGERWQFSTRLKKPWGLANPGSHNFQAWFAQTGIDARGSVSSGRAARLSPASPLARPHQRVRQTVSQRIADLDFDPRVKAVLRAVTVADKSGIDGRFWSLLQALGINHLMVISGLHIGLIAGGAYLLGALLARLVPASGRLAAVLPGLAALLLAGAYTALAGFSLPTVRALCMLGCFVVAQLAGRRTDGARPLLFAAALVLALNPLAGLGSGFWLSFSAVAALLWYSQWHRPSMLARLGGVHLFMSLVMIPIGSWWFGGASLVSAPVNFVMIPVVGFIVVPAALLAALSYLVGWPLEPFLWQLAAWPLQQLLPMAVDLGGTTEPLMFQPIYGDAWTMALAIVGVALWATPGGIYPGLLAILLCLPLVLPPVKPEGVPPGQTRITVLDVGQGTAVVVEAGFRALLYDTGGGDPAGANMARSVILPYLRSRGIRRLDTLVVSHPDQDHAAGVRDILGSMPVLRQRFGGSLSTMPRGKACVAGESWRWPGGPVFRFLSPAREVGLPSNDASCVLAIEAAGHRTLLTGDIEVARERELVRYWGPQLGSTWLLASHHGSKTSSSLTFLKTVAAQHIVISHGYASRFGHPHPEVLQRLRQSSQAVYSSAHSGALAFDFVPGEPIVVDRYRDRQQRYWM
jgi:competence protein ComEC